MNVFPTDPALAETQAASLNGNALKSLGEGQGSWAADRAAPAPAPGSQAVACAPVWFALTCSMSRSRPS
jgi:hypothetical protein